MLEKLVNVVTIRNETVRQGLAEALGTFLLMVREDLGCVEEKGEEGVRTMFLKLTQWENGWTSTPRFPQPATQVHPSSC